MVRLSRDGMGAREIARRLGASHSTVLRWVSRAGKGGPDAVDFGGGRPGRADNRVPVRVEREVLATRRRLKERGALGEYGAEAVRRDMEGRGRRPPSLRTINRIFERCGALDGLKRVRRKSPPPGWHIPDVAGKRAELDSFDYVEDLRIRGGAHVDVLTAVSLHGDLVSAWPAEGMSARFTCEKLVERWRKDGLPGYAQFDNGTVFCGGRWPGTIGSVMRLCLALGVVPVFAPPCETGFQAAIENYNGNWQKRVWQRREHTGLDELREWSDRHVAAHRAAHAEREDGAPSRRRFPKRFSFDETKRPRKGRMIFIRKTDGNGDASVLGKKYNAGKGWTHRLVRCEMDMKSMTVRIYGMRRREPENQPLLKTLKCKKFSKASGI